MKCSSNPFYPVGGGGGGLVLLSGEERLYIMLHTSYSVFYVFHFIIMKRFWYSLFFSFFYELFVL